MLLLKYQGKIVLDVGSGTGILSIFAAQAGAKKVFAVEASNLAILSREIIKENGFSDVIEVHQVRIEDFTLPSGLRHVDVIISEWMGFYLLHEGMLDSVLSARDRFLKPEGLLFPDRAMIYCAPCKLSSHFEYWDNVSGVKLTKFSEHLRKQKSNIPEIAELPKNSFLADPSAIAFIDLNDVTSEELDKFEFNEVLVSNENGNFQGVCIFFEVFFPSNNASDVVLSTNPDAPSTHWKQTIVPLPSTISITEIGTPIAFKMQLVRHPENRRHYNILLELLDADEVEHSLPCDCYLTKCILSKAHLEQSITQNGNE